MNLVKFLLTGTILSVILGEFGKFPFGGSTAVSVTDLFLSSTVITFLIWKLSTKQKISLPRSFKWLVGFYVVAILSLVYSLTFLTLTEVLIGSLYLIRFILYSFAFIVGFNLLKEKVVLAPSLVNLMIGVSVVLALIGVAQLFLYPNFEDPPFYLTESGYDPHRGRLASTLLDPNFLGAFLALNLGLIWINYFKGRSKLWLGVIGLVGAAVLLTLSRSAYLMIVVSTGVFCVAGYKFFSKLKLRSVGLLVTVILLALVFLPQVSQRILSVVQVDASSQERFESWDKGLTVFSSYPLLGVGFNNLRTVLTSENLIKSYTTQGGHAGAGIDSSILLVLATTGFLGAIFYLLFWIKSLASLYKEGGFKGLILFSILIGLLVNSQFINSLFFPPIMLWIFLTLAIGDFSREGG